MNQSSSGESSWSRGANKSSSAILSKGENFFPSRRTHFFFSSPSLSFCRGSCGAEEESGVFKGKVENLHIQKILKRLHKVRWKNGNDWYWASCKKKKKCCRIFPNVQSPEKNLYFISICFCKYCNAKQQTRCQVTCCGQSKLMKCFKYKCETQKCKICKITLYVYIYTKEQPGFRLMRRSLLFTTSYGRPARTVQTLHQWRAAELQKAGAPLSSPDNCGCVWGF